MKTLLAFCFALFTLAASAVTPFTFQFNWGAGTPNTNVALMTAWPPLENTFTVVGTNIVFGGSNIVLIPDLNGAGTNQAFAGSYRAFFTNLNFGFFVTIPDTTNQLPLANYVTGAPVFYEPINYYSLVTNWLSFPPATNTFVGIITVLGYTPATNSFGGITWSMGYVPATNTFNGITWSLGYTPVTNTFNGVTWSLGYTPMTNSYAAMTNAANFTFATNGGAIIYSQLPYTAPSNNLAGINGAQGYTSKTNDGYFGIQSAQWSLATNGFLVTVSYKTNGDPGSQFTNLPMGSVMYTTNGQAYVLSNIVWRLK